MALLYLLYHSTSLSVPRFLFRSHLQIETSFLSGFHKQTKKQLIL